ncbi:hypothetical protein CVT26_002822 [Gymnopilus dilepis]|uniref:Uncharacterized protein n=1 Tax=Gymnopilus dilepis TaxID=231916 RepID=A0A409Y347_9AGAR|nr:hypothetical protein CVT26_002822 [Gymnopilus dilepis]
MKFSPCLSFLPLLATCVSTVVAYPLYNSKPVELATRADFEDALIGYLQRRELEDALVDYLERRGGNRHSRPTDEERQREKEEKEREKQRHKEFREDYKQYKANGREIHKEAKSEGRTNVLTSYSGPAEHKKKAERFAEKEWKSNKNLQQFTHAEITMSEDRNGGPLTQVRYHKKDGKPGVYSFDRP